MPALRYKTIKYNLGISPPAAALGSGYITINFCRVTVVRQVTQVSGLWLPKRSNTEGGLELSNDWNLSFQPDLL